MKKILPLLTALYALVALLFGFAAVVLLGLSAWELFRAIMPDADLPLGARAATAIQSIGMLTVALMTLEMAQTVAEEEVVRRVQVSSPTRVRRYLSRFLVVVVVALSIESLVGVVQALHERPDALFEASSVAFGAAALLIAWAVFVRLNRSVEELEPQGIKEAQQEDHKVQ